MEPLPHKFQGVWDSTIKGVVTRRENKIERKFQTDTNKLFSEKASFRSNNIC